jgi:hypothetical protein
MYDYNARYYDPAIGKFISADTLVPGASRLTPLTVAFHETVFLEQANEENRQVLQHGPASSWSWQLKQQLGVPVGPLAPQTLNRLAYVANNPLGYTDPTGHSIEITLGAHEAQRLVDFLLGIDGEIGLADALKMLGQGVVIAGYVAGVIAGVMTSGASIVNILVGLGVAAGIAIHGERLKNTAETLKDLADLLDAELKAGSSSIKIEVKSELWGDRILVHGQQTRAVPTGRFLNHAGSLLRSWMIFGNHNSRVLVHDRFGGYYLRHNDGSFAFP